MRCSAPIQNLKGIRYRASGDLKPRCAKRGKYRGVCWDHLTPELRTHYRILARIRSFPDRDILGS